MSSNSHPSKTKISYEGLTYDDVLLIPAYSDVLPREVDISTNLTPEIKLQVPVVSAAMDTVTEFELAIAIAQEGGLGFLHKNMTIEQQATQVRKVKRSESGMIMNPYRLYDDAKMKDAWALINEHKIGGIPIVSKNNILVGILTNRDMRSMKNGNEPVKNLMTKKVITTNEGTRIEEAERILHKNKIEKLPIVSKSGELKGLITYKDIIKKRSFPSACKDHLGRLRVGAAVGVTFDLTERVSELIKAEADVICIDTAHGHSRRVLEAVKKIRKMFPDLQLIAGNVGTKDGCEALIEAGVHAVKVGIGPGSICTTRVITGVGLPQLSAVMEAAGAAKPKRISIVADGGIRFTGDIPKAIAAGADLVMSGNLFAGVEESPGETIIYEGRKFKTYRGMGSLEAMQTGSKDRYFQDVEDDIRKLVPEGIVGRVPYKGTLKEVMHQLVGGLRAAMGYCGTSTISDLQKAQFVRITSAGVRENHPHDVFITKEAPNYSPAS